MFAAPITTTASPATEDPTQDDILTQKPKYALSAPNRLAEAWTNVFQGPEGSRARDDGDAGEDDNGGGQLLRAAESARHHLAPDPRGTPRPDPLPQRSLE